MTEIESIQADAVAFTDREQAIDINEQLEFTARVRQLFGQANALAGLTDYRLGNLKERVEANPELRVNPTRLDAVVERRQNAAAPAAVRLAGLAPHDELWLPALANGSEAAKWGGLWSAEGGPVQDDGRYFEKVKKPQPVYTKLHFVEPQKEEAGPTIDKLYDLRYPTPGGELLPRRGYTKKLRDFGQAFRTPDGGLWTYPLMDMCARPSRRGETDNVASLHARTHPTVGPEALINMQWIHILAGKPLHPDIVDVSNEAICELGSDGEVVKMVGATCVTNARKKDGSVDFIRQLWHNARNEGGDYQLVNGISGIGRA